MTDNKDIPFEVDFDTEVEKDDGTGGSAVEMEERAPLQVVNTTKAKVARLMDIKIAIMEREIEEQFALGVYDNTLLKQIDKLAEMYDVGLSGEAKGKVMSAQERIKTASAKKIAEHTETAQKNSMKAAKAH